MVFSDGGYNDGTGIPALVHLKKKISISVLCPSPDALLYQLDHFYFANAITSSYGPYFGLVNMVSHTGKFSTNGPLNHMFDLNSNGENQTVKLIMTMASLKDNGLPMITTLEGLEVINNPFWGIMGGWKLDLTIILFVGVPQKFADQILQGIFLIHMK